MDYTYSVHDRKIRLTDERWRHIVEGHPEMAGYYHDVLAAIETPDSIYDGLGGEYLAVKAAKGSKVLVVIYRELVRDGFVITAFFTRRLQSFARRKKIWPPSH